MSKLTDFDMTEHIHQSNLIEDINNPVADADSMAVWLMLLAKESLDQSTVCRTQRNITMHQTDMISTERGYFRDVAKVNVTIGGRIAPPWFRVQMLMDNWFLDYNNLTPWNAHVRFERIHPFVDGNGRTGRMVMWWMEMKTGKEPTLFTWENRERYYDDLARGEEKLPQPIRSSRPRW